MTVVYVTHDQREALTLADRIAVMREGHIEQFAVPGELYSRPANRFVAGFIGDCNFLMPDAWSADDDRWQVRIGDCTYAVGGPGPSGDDAAQLAVRPHAMRLSSAPGEGLPGRVVDTFDLGDAIEHRVDLDHGETVIVRLAAPHLDSAQPTGERTSVGLVEEALVLV
jgi:ABC-type Fe3+/spermidine/putrescine transport system ATPase subunit